MAQTSTDTPSSPTPMETRPIDASATLVGEAPRFCEVVLSPNGRFVVYSLTRASVADNRSATELLLQALDCDEAHAGLARATRAANDR